MQGTKLIRGIALACVLAIGIGGSVYSGYWTKLARYGSDMMGQVAASAPAGPDAGSGVAAGLSGGHGPGQNGEWRGQAAGGGSPPGGAHSANSFNPALLPKVAGYLAVLALFAALVRLFEAATKRRRLRIGRS